MGGVGVLAYSFWLLSDVLDLLKSRHSQRERQRVAWGENQRKIGENQRDHGESQVEASCTVVVLF